MPIWITLKGGTREKVKSTAEGDEEKELGNLLTRTGQTYSYGWIEIERAEGRRLVSYDAVETVELDP